ncbi:30S ribosomal protein S12 methylthiotransferase RimO [candidate division TA06 bacterium]|uniref:Ribosomal protein uS12 methylthiotransferase RimO n=1 Tax=candidate division TA06 bacterium TaxID=2250710 RepID=A0A660SCU2_UNCT6|nr:MAG: 30S ribosomal protein S12 methylthiotransferase RimO [candidate division TA06 bacterium]
MEKKNKGLIFYIDTLGCFKNLVDSDILVQNLIADGLKKADDPESADILIVNTCGFIDDAKKESIETILSLASGKGERKLIVVGCLSERYREELLNLIPEIDIITGANNWDNIKYLIDNDIRISFNKRHYRYNKIIEKRILTLPHMAFVKISEGCSNNCAFCAIPQIRGKYRSRRMGVIVEEVKLLVKGGVREINLISQDSSYYGLDMYRKKALYDLLKKLDNIEGDFWIRVFYQNIDLFDNNIILLIRDSKHILPYFDIPIQHYSDKIIRLMNRGSDSNRIDYIMNLIREKIPDSVIRTSVIVGYPGERREDFEQLKLFLKMNKPDRIGVFKYSDEEGTIAYNFKEKNSDATKNRRLKKLIEISAENSLNRNISLIGKKLRVLIDTKEGGYYIARSKYDAFDVDNLVYIEDTNLKIGEFYNVVIEDAIEFDLFGKIV